MHDRVSARQIRTIARRAAVFGVAILAGLCHTRFVKARRLRSLDLTRQRNPTTYVGI